MSTFISVPREGHLDRLKQMYSYVSKMRYAAIRIRTEEPDFSIPPEDLNIWDHSVYEKVNEEIPKDTPKPLYKPVVMTHYEDVNLFPGITT